MYLFFLSSSLARVSENWSVMKQNKDGKKQKFYINVCRPVAPVKGIQCGRFAAVCATHWDDQGNGTSKVNTENNKCCKWFMNSYVFVAKTRGMCHVLCLTWKYHNLQNKHDFEGDASYHNSIQTILSFHPVLFYQYLKKNCIEPKLSFSMP